MDFSVVRAAVSPSLRAGLPGMPGVKLVGRQVATAGGPLDLLGIDPDGRLVIFELKRGTLTRDAVAQVLDYGSHLRSMSLEVLTAHIEERSGRDGIERIEGFADWYGGNFPDDPPGWQQDPRLVLVGLGADERARRMVDFLGNAGLDIQLLTFHGFQRDGQLLLARQVESEPPKGQGPSAAPGHREKLEHLRAQAEKLGVANLLGPTSTIAPATTAPRAAVRVESPDQRRDCALLASAARLHRMPFWHRFSLA